MADINFTCPNCRQNLEADNELRGETVQCPSCNTMIDIPAKLALVTPSNAPRMKECPYCSEQVLITAKKCKHCGEMIDISFESFKRNDDTKRNIQTVNINTPVYNRHNNSNDVDAWSGGTMTGYIFLTVLIPIVGIIVGIVGCTKEARRSQGITLIITGLISMILWSALMSSWG